MMLLPDRRHFISTLSRLCLSCMNVLFAFDYLFAVVMFTYLSCLFLNLSIFCKSEIYSTLKVIITLAGIILLKVVINMRMQF